MLRFYPKKSRLTVNLNLFEFLKPDLRYDPLRARNAGFSLAECLLDEFRKHMANQAVTFLNTGSLV